MKVLSSVIVAVLTLTDVAVAEAPSRRWTVSAFQ